jgi:hypothetical protein
MDPAVSEDRDPQLRHLYTTKDEAVRSQFYLMEWCEQAKPTDDGREHHWLSLEDAISRSLHEESRELLVRAGKASMTITARRRRRS